MSAPILHEGDWVFIEFPAKMKNDRLGLLAEQANLETAKELAKAFNAHGVMIQGWVASSSATQTRVVAVFRKRSATATVTARDVMPDD